MLFINFLYFIEHQILFYLLTIFFIFYYIANAMILMHAGQSRPRQLVMNAD